MRTQFLTRLLKDKAERNTGDPREQATNLEWYLRYLNGIEIDLSQPGFRALPDLVQRGKTTFDALVDSDPSQQKKYLSWLIRLYWTQGLMQEDFYKAKQYLDVLNRGRIRGFDINTVKSLPALFRVVEPYLDTLTQGQVTAQERKQIDRTTIIIYDGPEGKILTPLDERASKFWGRGTQWCTAADQNCMFNDYAKQGDLYIIITKNGEKYQLHLESASFMDETDARVDVDKFQARNPWVKPGLNLDENEMLTLVSKSGPRTHYIDFLLKWMNNPSEEFFEGLLEENGAMIIHIGNFIKLTPELAEVALKSTIQKKNHYEVTVFQFCIKHGLFDSERILDIVEFDFNLARVLKDISYFPLVVAALKSPRWADIALRAVRKNPFNVQYVTDPSNELIHIGLDYDPHMITAFERWGIQADPEDWEYAFQRAIEWSKKEGSPYKQIVVLDRFPTRMENFLETGMKKGLWKWSDLASSFQERLGPQREKYWNRVVE